MLWGDDAVRQQATRAGEVVDQLPRLDDLFVGQKPPARVIERRAAQERDVGVAVVVDLLHIILEFVAGKRGDAFLLHPRVPVLARKVRKPKQLLVIEVVTHEMGLDIEDELISEALGARQHQFGLAGLGGRDLEDIAVDVVHGEKRRRHAAACVQELPAAQAEVLAVHVRELVDPCLDLLLRRALRGRKILAVGNNLGRYRRCRRCRLRARDETLFSLTEPAAHGSPPFFVGHRQSGRCPCGPCAFGHSRSVKGPARRTFPGSTKHEAIALASSPGETTRGFSPRDGRHTRKNYLR